MQINKLTHAKIFSHLDAIAREFKEKRRMEVKFDSEVAQQLFNSKTMSKIIDFTILSHWQDCGNLSPSCHLEEALQAYFGDKDNLDSISPIHNIKFLITQFQTCVLEEEQKQQNDILSKAKDSRVM